MTRPTYRVAAALTKNQASTWTPQTPSQRCVIFRHTIPYHTKGYRVPAAPPRSSPAACIPVHSFQQDIGLSNVQDFSSISAYY